jgi:hypothetical protein
MTKRTWKVLELGIAPTSTLSLCCPHCGTDAVMPVGEPDSPVIAAVGLGLIFDNPTYRPAAPILPKTIKCRTCRRVFTTRKGSKKWT